MDLILWRHADAQAGPNDLARELTAKGREQAARIAEWLLQRLPSGFLLIASPAARAQQTAQTLGTPKISRDLAPGAAVSAILKAAAWPDGKDAAVVVGHQPDLGRAAAYLIAGSSASVSIRKGALWWFSNRERDDEMQAVVRAVISPDLL